ncbi:MAG: hypothetical protein QNJ40_17890 [Xanthomonadales bacterium]|nr:hypothetical protein [Xanthomonadales bacterium]
MNRLTLSLLLLLLCAPTQAAGLFETDSVIDATIEMEMDRFCRNPERQDCIDLPAVFTYQDDAGQSVSVNMKLRIRGRWGPKTGNCTFPSVFAFFDTATTSGTIFEGQDMLPLTTHCKKPGYYEQYLLKEYYAHEIYEVITPRSMGSRLVRATYRDSEGKKDDLVRYAFFTENFRTIAEKNDARVLNVQPFNPLDAQPFQLALHDLFQFMIGNTDWSMIFDHNRLLLEDPDGPYPVPYDLDYSGLVNAKYAQPSEKLKIRKVETRLFRGFCRRDIPWDRVFAHFRDTRDQVMARMDIVPGLSDGSKRRMTIYLEAFYKVIDAPRKREREIIKACRKIPRGLNG